MPDISGIGFKTADKIARNMGIDPGSQIQAPELWRDGPGEEPNLV
jgi:hypothetical protein